MTVLSSTLDSSLGPAVCRVCLCGEASIPYLGKVAGEPLISPCHCKGTMGLYHRSCLEHWLSTSHTHCCEICQFRYEIGRRKQGFISYLRANSWFANGDHPRSIGSDCVCLLMFAPLTLGGSVLCIQNINEHLRNVDQNGELENVYEILGLGFLALFLIVMFIFWVIFTVVFYFHDFRVWQKKNLVLYVIDQIDKENETYSRSQNYGESQRPLLLKRRIWKFLVTQKVPAKLFLISLTVLKYRFIYRNTLQCCGDSSSQNTAIPLQGAVVDSPQVVQTISSTAQAMGSTQQLRFISPISRSSVTTPQQTSRSTNTSTAFISVSTSQVIEMSLDTISNLSSHRFPTVSTPTMSTFGPRVTPASSTTRTPMSAPARSTSLSTVARSANRCVSDEELTRLHPVSSDSQPFVELYENAVEEGTSR